MDRNDNAFSQSMADSVKMTWEGMKITMFGSIEEVEIVEIIEMVWFNVVRFAAQIKIDYGVNFILIYTFVFQYFLVPKPS